MTVLYPNMCCNEVSDKGLHSITENTYWTESFQLSIYQPMALELV